MDVDGANAEKPARSNIAAVPMFTEADEIRVPPVWTGIALERAGAVLAGIRDGRVQQRARRRRSGEPPLATTKQLIHPDVVARQLAGASATWPAGRSPREVLSRPPPRPCRRHRGRPGRAPDCRPSTSDRRSSRLASAVVLLQLEPGFLQNRHQHHFGSPPAANSSATAGQVADVTGTIAMTRWSLIGRQDVQDLPAALRALG